MNIRTWLIAVAGMAVFAGSAQAQQEQTTYRYDRKGNCIYSNFGGYETIYTYDGKSNLTNQSSTGAYPQPKRQEAPAPQLTLAPRPVYVNTDLHAAFEYAAPAKQTARVQAAATPAATVVATPYVVTAADIIANDELDRQAAIQRAKVDAAQHAKNVKAAQSFKNGE